MKKIQPVKKDNKQYLKNKFNNKPIINETKKNYGISKLESFFAHEYLDKLNLKYIYEYEARDIGRFFDFAVILNQNIDFLTENKHGIVSVQQVNQKVPIAFFIETDGDFFHGNPETLQNKKLSNMQKRNQKVDKLKNDWCKAHGIPLLRLWENDIKNNPQLVMEKINQHLILCGLKK
jgi:hypothetical protein